MVDKTPAELDPGVASDTSVVHSSENDVITNSKKHTERDISRLQGTAQLYSSSKTYTVNDLVTESDIVYRCINAIAIPEPFNIANWSPIAGGGTNPSFIMNCNNSEAISSGTDYLCLTGFHGEVSTIPEAAISFPNACTLRRMTFEILTQKNAIQTFTLLINGVAGNQTLSIPASTTGTFQDLSNTDVIANGDQVAYELVVAGGGTLTIGSTALEVIAA